MDNKENRSKRGSKGGLARTEKTKLRGFGRPSLTPEQRKAISSHAANIRWGNKND